VEDARKLIERYGLKAKFPASVNRFFEREDLPESPGNKSLLPAFFPRRTDQALTRKVTASASMTGEDETFRDSVFEVLLSSHDLVENARALAARAGYFVAVDNSCDDWDYAVAARYLLERFHSLRAAHDRLCLISVGEVTVTIDRAPGAGGRNQQFALQCALDLAKYPHQRLTVFSAGSDGIDGNTRSAGAFADVTTVARAKAFGYDPEASLAAFNACPLFTALGDSFATGPTGQNLRDLRLLIAEKA
jgi:hydroxypyruvate reductase